MTYVYQTLPKVTPNSSEALDHFVTAFIRLFMDGSGLFKGTSIDNSVQQYFTEKVYHRTHGEGKGLIGYDGLSVDLIWLHVDDTFINDPNS